MKLRHSQQENDYYCGPAVVEMVLVARGVRLSQRKIAKLLHTTSKNGTSTRDLVKGLRMFGLKVRAKNNYTLAQLKSALRSKSIIIVCYTERHRDWDHYAIVLRLNDTSIILIDPAEKTPYLHMKLDEFKKRWKGELFTHTIKWAAIIEGKARSPLVQRQSR